ncbi:MAG: hypothetical protein JWR75_517 [Devosia sp.]|nr:hypothetical protein [Devosia sp.]
MANESPEVAKVDFLVDENGRKMPLPADSGITATRDTERAVGATGPGAWSRYLLIGFAIAIAVLLALQLFQGAPSTEVQSGTPVAEPVTEQLATPPAQ